MRFDPLLAPEGVTRPVIKLSVVSLSIIALVAAPAAAKSSSEFLKDAVQGDRSEMTLGRVIENRGQSSKVRAYGATLSRDHRQAHEQAVALAERMHTPVTDTMMPEARSEMAKLQRLHGRAFDREVRRYMIEDHHTDIAEFKSQSRHGDRQTAALAAQTLPVLQKHLALAEALPK